MWILQLLLYSKIKSQHTYSKKPLKYLRIVLKWQQNKWFFFSFFCKYILVLIILQNDPIRLGRAQFGCPFCSKTMIHRGKTIFMSIRILCLCYQPKRSSSKTLYEQTPWGNTISIKNYLFNWLKNLFSESKINNFYQKLQLNLFDFSWKKLPWTEKPICFSIFRYKFFLKNLENKFYYYYFTEWSNKTWQRAICMPILQSNNATSSIYEKTYYDTYWGETIFVWILRLLLYSENSSQFTYSKKPLKYLSTYCFIRTAK